MGRVAGLGGEVEIGCALTCGVEIFGKVDALLATLFVFMILHGTYYKILLN